MFHGAKLLTDQNDCIINNVSGESVKKSKMFMNQKILGD